MLYLSLLNYTAICARIACIILKYLMLDECSIKLVELACAQLFCERYASYSTTLTKVKKLRGLRKSLLYIRSRYDDILL